MARTNRRRGNAQAQRNRPRQNRTVIKQKPNKTVIKTPKNMESVNLSGMPVNFPEGGINLPSVPQYPVQQAAENQVALSQQGLLDEIAGQQRATYNTWQESDTGMQNIGKGLMNSLSKPDEVQSQMQGIGQTLNQNLGGLAGQVDDMGGASAAAGPPAALAGEQGANAALFGQLGSNSQAMLAGQAQSAVSGQNAIRNQGAVDIATRRANYLEGFQDQIQALREGRLDVMKDDPMQILAQRNTLADQRFGQEAARFGMGMDLSTALKDKNFTKALLEVLRGQGGGGGGGLSAKAGKRLHGQTTDNDFNSPGENPIPSTGNTPETYGRGRPTNPQGKTYEQLENRYEDLGPAKRQQFLKAHPKFKKRRRSGGGGGVARPR